MKVTKGLMGVLVLAALVVGGAHQAFGFGSETATGTWFDQEGVLDPHAKGTEVRGTMTIYYQLQDPEQFACVEGAPNATMYVFLRLKKHNAKQELGFSTMAEVCVTDFQAQKAAVDAYLEGCVIPALFPNKPDARFALKSVSRYVTDDPFAFEGTTCADQGLLTPMFAMVDIVLAVQDRKHCPHQPPRH